jgi:hypothetical protein
MAEKVPAGQKSKDNPWYQEDPVIIQPEARELLENYSHVAPDQIEKHVLDIVSLRERDHSCLVAMFIRYAA